MTRYERHPAPEKLLLQITTEAVNLLALGTQDKPADVSLLETGAALTVKAWGLPQELLESSTALIQHQKELLATASGKAALPDSGVEGQALAMFAHLDKAGALTILEE